MNNFEPQGSNVAKKQGSETNSSAMPPSMPAIEVGEQVYSSGQGDRSIFRSCKSSGQRSRNKPN